MLTLIVFQIIIPFSHHHVFKPFIPHRPSTSPTFNLIHLQPHPPSTFFDLQPFHASSDLRPPTSLQLSHTHTHTHTILVRWLDVTRFRKMRIMLRGLRVSPPNRAWQTWSCCSQPIEFWCRRTDALRSGPTSSPCVVEPSLHVVGAGGQTLFAAGLPTFRFVAGLIQFPGLDLACSFFLAVAALVGEALPGGLGGVTCGIQPGGGSRLASGFCGGHSLGGT